MANQEHLDILKQGVDAWNEWRRRQLGRLFYLIQNENNIDITRLQDKGLFKDELNSHKVDLSSANLSHRDLSRAILYAANLSDADLGRANLSYANLNGANLSKASLTGANLQNANLQSADLSRANLRHVDLRYVYSRGANYSEADLSHAYISNTDLSETFFCRSILYNATLVNTSLNRAELKDCFIYGISVWQVDLTGAKQEDLVITAAFSSSRNIVPDLPSFFPFYEPKITVDNLEMAQFIYLLLSNQKIRDVIDTITSKVVLILGRFATERKKVLDALRNELRKRNYSPVLFDFEKPASRDLTETVSILAHMARFVIADLTDAKSIPQELKTIVPNLPSVAVQPLILSSQHEYGMFEHFTRFPWVLPIYRYRDEASLLQSLQEKVIEPAERKAQELAPQ